MRVVLDASTAVHLLLGTEPGLRARSRLPGLQPVAPALIDTEVMSAVARLERAGEIETPQADEAIAAWRRFPCERAATQLLTAHIWALRTAVRVADAHYVALALALEAPLMTADRRLARAPVTALEVLMVQ